MKEVSRDKRHRGRATLVWKGAQSCESQRMEMLGCRHRTAVRPYLSVCTGLPLGGGPGTTALRDAECVSPARRRLPRGAVCACVRLLWLQPVLSFHFFHILKISQIYFLI